MTDYFEIFSGGGGVGYLKTNYFDKFLRGMVLDV